MAERNLPHIVVGANHTTSESFTSARSGPSGSPSPPSPPDRLAHRDKLTQEMAAAIALAAERRADLPDDAPRPDGVYLTFESYEGYELALGPLDAGASELRATTTIGEGDDAVRLATVFVSDSARSEFLEKLDQYAFEETRTGAPKNRALAERTAAIQLATLRGLWTDSDASFPDEDTEVWWEVWLRHRPDTTERLGQFSDAAQVRLGRRRLVIDDRLVVMIRGTATQLGHSLHMLDDVAEFRRPAPIAAEIDALEADDQTDLVDALIDRLEPPDESAPRVCVLDTGVSAGHPMLAPALDFDDVHVVDPAWSDADLEDHGTGMAGIALYGEVANQLVRSGAVHLPFRLESVKILPDNGRTEPELWGAVTAQAVAIAELSAPGHDRSFVLSATAEHESPDDPAAFGIPTLWSAAIDALAAGRDVDVDDYGIELIDTSELAEGRLLLLATGNIRDGYEPDHLAFSDRSPVEAPAQAWNALVVGGCTLHDHQPTEPAFVNYRALAPAGELSPLSRTSVSFDTPWRIAPDFVMEAGNVAHGPPDVIGTVPSLGVLTTRSLFAGGGLLTMMDGTSPATAQAANLVGQLRADHPGLWPETIRALAVTSARWTPQMARHLGATVESRLDVVRRYGWGVPDLERAQRSATDALTLVAERTIQPFQKGEMAEMHVHDLPWPVDALESLGAVECRMRVALSYFIEPNPARRGWFRRYQYPSHGLQFSVRRATETTDEMRARVNKDARNGRTAAGGGSPGNWVIGPQRRHKGSLHVDELTCNAADLAARGCLAVYPTGGWWKDLPAAERRDRVIRYSLVVTIETPEVGADIWTPVAQQVGIETDVPVIIEIEIET